MSIFHEWQAWNRNNFSSYYEIFLDVPAPILEARDTKRLYVSAREGRIKNVVGCDINFPRPINPDLILTNIDQELGIDANIGRILDVLPSFKS